MPLSLLSALVLASAPYSREAPIFVDDDFRSPRSASIAVAGASRARVFARAGSLRIEGRNDLHVVRVTGTARSSSRRLLDEINVTASRVGDAVEVRVELPETTRWGDRALLDLVVELPADLALAVDDSAGDAII